MKGAHSNGDAYQRPAARQMGGWGGSPLCICSRIQLLLLLTAESASSCFWPCFPQDLGGEQGQAQSKLEERDYQEPGPPVSKALVCSLEHQPTPKM